MKLLDDRLIGFTQGLLVEAVDKSYAMGFIKILFGATYLKPPTSVKKVLREFGSKAAIHWFQRKKVSVNDLHNIKIYDSVRNQIDTNFRKHFKALVDGLVMNKPFKAVIEYAKANSLNQVLIWGC